MSFYNNCDFYEIIEDDKITMITVDLSFISKAPIEQNPLSVILEVKFKLPDENGLPGKEDFQTSTNIEDKIIESIENKTTTVMSRFKKLLKLKPKDSTDIFYVARCFDKGKVDFAFYCKEGYNFEGFCKKLMADFTGYEFNLYHEIDKEWEFYTDFLYPSPLEFQLISDRNLIDRLEELGDNSEIPRDISYWIYFKNDGSRQKCLSELLENGYKFEQNHDLENEEYNLGIVINKNSLLNLETASSHSTFLYEMAEKYDGNYDGWETPVMK